MAEHDGEQARATAKQDEAPLLAQQPASAPKHTSGEQANHMLASVIGQRVTPPAKAEHDFGEHIVGSDNNIEQIHAPWNLSDTPATAQFSVSGEAFQLASMNVMALKPSRQMRGDDLTYAERASPRIVFRPRRGGEFQGTLTIKISWPMDGHVETQTIALRGRARELTQAPTHFGPESPREQTDNLRDSAPETSRDNEAGKSERADAEAPVTKQELRNKDEVDGAIEDAAAAARKLARSQRDGLKIVEDEAAAYGKEIPKTPRSKWWDLAEMALSLATGNLAGLFAKKLLPRLLSKTLVDDIPMVGEVKTTITPKLSEGVTGTISAAIVAAGQKAIKAGLPSETATAAAPTGHAEGTAGKRSSNARIDFFAEQRSVLNEQEDAYEEKVKQHAKQVRPLALGQPKQAVEALSVVAQELTQMKSEAEQQQANATAPAWATLVARLGLGHDVVRTAENSSDARQATHMDTLRRTDHGTPANAASGVLDVYVSSGKVVSARLNGVAQEIADRLANIPLADVPMPIRFIMGRPGEPKPAILTRDETGRVRVQGELMGQTNESEAVRTATEIIERTLSVQLAAMGIEIQTDDSTRRGP
jgi:hypothetical protein